VLLNQYIEKTIIGETTVEESVVLKRNDIFSKTVENNGSNNFYQLFDYPENKDVVIGEIVEIENGDLSRSDKKIVGLQAIKGLELGYVENGEFKPIEQLSADYSYFPPVINLESVIVNIKYKSINYDEKLNGTALKNESVTLEKLSVDIKNKIDTHEESINDLTNDVDNLESYVSENLNKFNTLENQIRTLNNQVLKISEIEDKVIELTTEVITNIPKGIENNQKAIEALNKSIESMASLTSILNNRLVAINSELSSIKKDTKKMIKITPVKDSSLVQIPNNVSLKEPDINVFINGFKQSNYSILKRLDDTIDAINFSPDKFKDGLVVEIEYTPIYS
jgi:methyl-accepting chemotaxis protein